MFFEADFSQSGVEGKQIKEIQQREQLTPELGEFICVRELKSNSEVAVQYL